MDHKTCAIIVTYANRFFFLEKVVESLIINGIDHVVIVDNNSVEESKNKLKDFEKKADGFINVIYLTENYGSAAGFKTGIKYILETTDYKYFWLLDDDNVPEKDALSCLKRYWCENSLDDHNIILVSFRENREEYRRALYYNNPEELLGALNSFYTFDFFKHFIKFFRPKNYKHLNLPKAFEIYQAPYGGMFTQRSTIQKIGFPDDRFFVYFDDTEYSHRLIKQNGKILLITDSRINDIDTSWHNQDIPMKNQKKSIINSHAYDKLYYSVRNRVYFETRNRVNNFFLYLTNLLIYLIWLTVLGLSYRKFKNTIIIYKATYDGMIGKLGKRNNDDWIFCL